MSSYVLKETDLIKKIIPQTSAWLDNIFLFKRHFISEGKETKPILFTKCQAF